VPTGTVDFYNGSIAPANLIPDCTPAANPVPVDGTGTATCTTSSLTAPSASLVAAYSGDGTYLGEDSSVVAQTVAQISPNLTFLATAPSSSTSVNQAVTFSAALGAVAFTPITPTGSVNFTVGTAPATTISGCGTQALALVAGAWTATCTTSSLAPGANQTIGAVYTGDTNFATATAPTITQTITVTAVNVTVGTSPAGLLVSVDGGAPTAAPLVETWNIGSSHTIATTSPQAGTTGVQYVWNSWSDSGAISHSITVPSTAATYTASFTTQYQLTTQASPSADGSVTAPTSGGYYAAGALIPVVAAPASVGYLFNDWTSTGGTFVSPTSPSTNFTMPSAATTVTANFVVNNVAVTLDTSPQGLLVSVNGGTPQAAPLTVPLQVGSQQTIATSTPQGTGGTQYTFVSWSDAGAISHTITVPATATAYTASFSTSYLLTTGVSPSGGGTVAPATGYQDANSTVPLTATPAAGYVFSSWIGPVASASSASTTVTMSAPETVTANFISALTVSPYPSYSFGTVYLGTLTTENFTVSNTGTTPITMNGPFISILQGGDSEEFVEVDECPKSLPGGSHCTISVTFVAGPFYSPQTAILSIMDNAPGNPQKVTLTATVIDPQASFTPRSLSFGKQSVGTPTTKTVTLKNTGATTLSNISMTVTGTNAAEFTLTPSSTCGSSLASGSSCTISVTFEPVAKVSYSATLQVTDNTQSGEQTVPLSGTGH